MAWHNNGIHESPEMLLIKYFIKKSAVAGPTAWLLLPSEQPKEDVKGGLLTYYIQVLTRLLETYTSDGIMAETGSDIVRFT